MNDNPSPVFLKGAIHTPVWSGSRLSETYRCFGGAGKIGEVWLTSDSESLVMIDERAVAFGEYLRITGNPVPPLVKLIDAGAPLSIQVHPDEIAAMKHGGISKSEIWYVLAADPGATILYGIVDGVTADDVRYEIRYGDAEPLLRRIAVQTGDVFMIPPGMIHSLGAGVTVLEVQSCAGTTYRVKDLAGNRETHPEKSADSLRIFSMDAAFAEAFADPDRIRKFTLPGNIIAATADYALTRCISSDDTLTYDVNAGVCVFCESGSGKVGNIIFSAGDSLFFGYGGRMSLDPHTTVFFIA